MDTKDLIADLNEEEKAKLFREEKYNYVRWSTEETLFRNPRKYKEDIFSLYSFPFSSAARIKLRNSCFGKYVDTFNPNEEQDMVINENKLAIMEWDIKRFKPNESVKFEKQNSITQNYFDILKYAVKKCDVITMDCIQKKIKKLSIIDFYINFIDVDLRNFYNLRILILSGNNLRTLDGSTLPRRLAFLELFNNFISSIKDLVNNAPRTISYLGLARNKLDDNSSLYLLKSTENFKLLKVLDLACNDICDLEATLNGLEGLDSLKGFSLEGNPCAVVPSYKEAVLLSLRSLMFLDDVHLLKKDKKISSDDTDQDKKDQKPQLLFVCHRIMGLPKPPKDKKVKKAVQTIHLEVELPLLEKVHFPEPEPPVVEDGGKSSKKSGKKEKKSKKDSKSSKSSKKSGKKKPPYEWPDEYDPMFEKTDFSYKSVRKPWNKAIQYPPIFIESPEDNNVCIRDTFKSIVNVRVVYLKILPAKFQKVKKDKKSKKDKKEKKDKKKGGKKDKSQKGEKVKPPPPQDLTLKRVTIGNFYCDLRSVSWSDETVDFYWADHPKIGSNALYMDGCLKALKYTDKPPKKKKPPKKGKGGTEVSLIVEEDPATIKNLYPKIVTCQVGFGLKR